MNINILKINNDNDNDNDKDNNNNNNNKDTQNNIVDIKHEQTPDVVKPYINQLIQQIKKLWDELKDFYNELVYLIYVDLNKSYLFIVSNKTYFIYAFILSILIQFTNINTLSSSYRKKISKQYGGSNAFLGTADLAVGLAIDKKAENTLLQAADAHKKNPPIDPKNPPIDPNKPPIDPNKPAHNSTKNIKENKMHLSYFEQIKATYGKNTKLGGKYGALGPVFSNMDKIFGSVSYIFSFIAVVLAVVGVLSLPVLIFLIITYNVIKKMVNTFLIL